MRQDKLSYAEQQAKDHPKRIIVRFGVQWVRPVREKHEAIRTELYIIGPGHWWVQKEKGEKTWEWGSGGTFGKDHTTMDDAMKELLQYVGEYAIEQAEEAETKANKLRAYSKRLLKAVKLSPDAPLIR